MGYYRIINPTDSSGKTRRTVMEAMYDLYNLGEEVKRRQPGMVINPWDAQAFALGITNQRDWNTQLDKQRAEERERMALVDAIEKDKKRAQSSAMEGMSPEEKAKYREKLKAQEDVEKLRLYLEQEALHAAERKKGLMPRSIQATNEEKPFDALARIEASRFQEGRSGLLPGPGYGPYQAGSVDLSASDEFYRRKRNRPQPAFPEDY